MADAWQVPARLALFVFCRHTVGPFVYFKGVRAHLSTRPSSSSRLLLDAPHVRLATLINAGSSLTELRSMEIGSIEPR